MSLSNADMKPGTLSSLSAASIELKRSITSAWGSAYDGIAKTNKTTQASAQGVPTVLHLRPIAAIDFDVLLGQVAGPEARIAFPVPLDHEFDQALVAVQF